MEKMTINIGGTRKRLENASNQRRAIFDTELLKDTKTVKITVPVIKKSSEIRSSTLPAIKNLSLGCRRRLCTDPTRIFVLLPLSAVRSSVAETVGDRSGVGAVGRRGR